MIRSLTTRAGAATFVLAVVVLGGAAGCGTSSTTSPAPPATPTAAAPPTTGTTPATACADVVAKGNDVVSTAVQVVTGQVPASQVSASVQALENSVASAKAASSGTVAEQLNGVQTAAGGLKLALQTQPIDPAAIRTAAQQLGTALKGLTTVCAPGSTAPAAVPTT